MERAFACTLRRESEECVSGLSGFGVVRDGEESDEQAECHYQCFCG